MSTPEKYDAIFIGTGEGGNTSPGISHPRALVSPPSRKMRSAAPAPTSPVYRARTLSIALR